MPESTMETLRQYLEQLAQEREAAAMPDTTPITYEPEVYDPTGACPACDSGSHGSTDETTGNCNCCGASVGLAEWERELIGNGDPAPYVTFELGRAPTIPVYDNVATPKPYEWKAPRWMDVSAIADERGLHSSETQASNTMELAYHMERLGINEINERTAPHLYSRMRVLQMVEGNFMKTTDEFYTMRELKMSDISKRFGLRLTNFEPDRQMQPWASFISRYFGTGYDASQRRSFRAHMRDCGLGH